MITQGNILLAQGTSAQIETSARPNMFVHNSTDKSLVYSPDGIVKYRYDDRSTIDGRFANIHTHSNKSQLDTIDQNLGTGNTVSFNQVIATNNGNGENFRVGDDAWIGDVNVANTIWVKGITLPGQGYVGFGSDSNKLGYTGSFLSYSGMVKFGPGTHPEIPGNYQPFIFDVTNAGGWGNISIVNNSPSFATGIILKTTSNTNSNWNIQKRDDGLYGTSFGCFAIEDSTCSSDQRRFPIVIDYGDSGIIRLSRPVTLTDGRNISLTKDITPTTATNTNYSSAPIVIKRATQDSSTSTAAGLGFHNQGVNASTLYYDPATSVFKYNRHDSGPLVTIWDDSNLTPGNYLKKSDTFGGSDGYEFSVESGTDSGGLCLKLIDDNNGSEYFVVRNSDGNPSLIAYSDRTVNVGYQNYTSFKPTLEIGDDQYGLSVDAGYLNMFSNSGDVRVYSKVGAGDAVLKGMVWHSGNLPVTASHLSGTTSNLQTQINNIKSGATVNVVSVASNTQLNATGRHLSATIPANTISQTVPTQVKVVGKIGANYVGGTATIEIEIGGNNVFTHTMTATGQNEDDVFEIDFGIRYAGSSTIECFGLCKIDNIVTTTQTPKMRYVSSFFAGVPSTEYAFDVKSTITGTAGASVTLVKITKG